MVFNDTIQDIGFNTYHTFPGKKCQVTTCSDPAYFECIGLQVPEWVSKDDLSQNHTPKEEIFKAAKIMLDGGLSLDRLTVFLKSKIIPTYKSFTADTIIRHHAELILVKLNISLNQSLSDYDKDRILTELRLYPNDNL